MSYLSPELVSYIEATLGWNSMATTR